MLIDLQTYSAISYGSHIITWIAHIAGISVLVSRHPCSMLASPVSKYLLQQVALAQVRPCYVDEQSSQWLIISKSSSTPFLSVCHTRMIELFVVNWLLT
jgi:hypothetical protein